MQQLSTRAAGYGKWVVERFEKPVAFLASLLAIIAVPSLIWAFIASQLEIDAGQLFRVFVVHILPLLLLYGLSVALLIRAALLTGWHPAIWHSMLRLTLLLIGAAAIILLGYQDLRWRSREWLVLRELRAIETLACNGQYKASLDTIERLKLSARYSFLGPDLDRAAHYIEDLALIRDEQPSRADGAGVSERALLFNTPPAIPKNEGTIGPLGDAWRASQGRRCP